MPIRPENKHLYPPGWKAISDSIRFIRAGSRCEWIENGERCKAIHGLPHPITGSKVVLTVMHLDHDPTNNAESNLLAACQLHHNRYDAAERAKNRKRKRKNALTQVEGDTHPMRNFNKTGTRANSAMLDASFALRIKELTDELKASHAQNTRLKMELACYERDIPATVAGKMWREFQADVLTHIDHYTVPQYGDWPDCPAAQYGIPEIKTQLARYINRIGSNARGPEEALRDCLKIAHYASFLWRKLLEDNGNQAA